MDTNSVYIMTSRMAGQRKQLDAMADNIANVTTNGHKGARVEFQEILGRNQGNQVAKFSDTLPTTFDFSQGSLKTTSNPLDVSIQGEGFFAVDVNGAQVYTRNGHFTLDAEGNLTTSNGNFVLDANNAPISIPPGSNEISITREGVVSTNIGDAGTLGVFKFDPQAQAGLVRAGNNGFVSTNGAPTVVESPTIIQATLEESNINSIAEITRMTELNRAYQSAAKLVKSVEDLQQKSIRELSRLPN